MKSVRFTQVVEKSGKPEVYLLFTPPKEDHAFQQALKANRILTVRSEAGSTDRGVVGYEADPHAQLLIFPRSLKSFEGKTVVGIKYDLLREEHEPVKREAKTEPKKKAASSTGAKKDLEKIWKKEAEPKRKKSVPEKIAPGKVVKFPREEIHEQDEDDDSEIKAQVRRAMKALEDGKQVAAFNILKNIVKSGG